MSPVMAGFRPVTGGGGSALPTVVAGPPGPPPGGVEGVVPVTALLPALLPPVARRMPYATPAATTAAATTITVSRILRFGMGSIVAHAEQRVRSAQPVIVYTYTA